MSGSTSATGPEQIERLWGQMDFLPTREEPPFVQVEDKVAEGKTHRGVPL